MQLTRFWEYCLSNVQQSTGLWLTSQVLADIRVGIHCSGSNCASGIVTPWIIQRLRWSVDMATAVGETQQAADWNATAELMVSRTRKAQATSASDTCLPLHPQTAAFRKYLVVTAGDLPPHVPDVLYVQSGGAVTTSGYSQAGQTIAVSAGLLTPKEAQATLQHAFPAPSGAPPHTSLCTCACHSPSTLLCCPAGSPPATVTRWNNPTYMFRALTALSYANMTDRAVSHLKERFAQYLPNSPDNPIPAELQGVPVW